MRQQESWTASTTFNSPKLKLDFFHLMLPWNVIRTTETRFLASIPLLTLFLFMLHDCITHDINMTILWWMDVTKSRYQFISSSWGFLSTVTPWFVSNIGNTSIKIRDVLKTYLSSFLTTSAEHLFCRAPFHGCLW